ncbi:DUF4183 domain-containing protein [Sporosarcina sp. YIM B06819]|uniref:DUF4183 domain-containing protein n=1 Tax=Sporosarcina sp. YIM B06819 TaxID=3081769 RepID=UPI00298C8349|nr:DUF4183 domain-containing protein [Sporosarcina sp. YIM B06819]
MKKCNNQNKIMKMNKIDICRIQTKFWPAIKISSACIGVPPINPPTNFPEINIIPTVKRYFYVASANMNLTNGTTILSTQFYNDDGSQTKEFMSFSPNGYANLYINAVIQEGAMYAVNTSTLTISPSNSIIYRGTPIILELLTFTAEIR